MECILWISLLNSNIVLNCSRIKIECYPLLLFFHSEKARNERGMSNRNLNHWTRIFENISAKFRKSNRYEGWSNDHRMDQIDEMREKTHWEETFHLWVKWLSLNHFNKSLIPAQLNRNYSNSLFVSFFFSYFSHSYEHTHLHIKPFHRELLDDIISMMAFNAFIHFHFRNLIPFIYDLLTWDNEWKNQ